MKIVHVIRARLPVSAYGGTERAAYWTAKAQAEAGHGVHVLCEAGSTLPFATVGTVPDESVGDLSPYLPARADVVHFWAPSSLKSPVPALTTVQGNGKPGEVFPANTVFVSRNHAERHGWTEYVHNGLDLGEYPVNLGKRRDRLAFLAKASWRVKNLKGSMRIAKRAGMALDVMGGNGKPRDRLLNRHVTFHGYLTTPQKNDVLRQSRALVFPVLWEEPFGIAVIEALACGAPVLATPRGSLPEIVSSECGLLSESEEALAEAALRAKAGKFAPEACRARVERLFTHHRMAEDYIELYRRLVANGRLREGQPRTLAPRLD